MLHENIYEKIPNIFPAENQTIIILSTEYIQRGSTIIQVYI